LKSPLALLLRTEKLQQSKFDNEIQNKQITLASVTLKTLGESLPRENPLYVQEGVWRHLLILLLFHIGGLEIG
jgi:hypothetical protein